MSEWMIAFASFLLVNVFVGMIRIWRGPTAADRMLATPHIWPVVEPVDLVVLLAVQLDVDKRGRFPRDAVHGPSTYDDAVVFLVHLKMVEKTFGASINLRLGWWRVGIGGLE